jgi:hypothetical protein
MLLFLVNSSASATMMAGGTPSFSASITPSTLSGSYLTAPQYFTFTVSTANPAGTVSYTWSTNLGWGFTQSNVSSREFTAYEGGPYIGYVRCVVSDGTTQLTRDCSVNITNIGSA